MINTDRWQEKLPGSIEAFFWVAGVDGEELGEEKARKVHADFLRRYPRATVQLVKMDIAGHPDRPITVVDPPRS